MCTSLSHAFLGCTIAAWEHSTYLARGLCSGSVRYFIITSEKLSCIHQRIVSHTFFSVSIPVEATCISHLIVAHLNSLHSQWIIFHTFTSDLVTPLFKTLSGPSALADVSDICSYHPPIADWEPASLRFSPSEEGSAAVSWHGWLLLTLQTSYKSPTCSTSAAEGAYSLSSSLSLSHSALFISLTALVTSWNPLIMHVLAFWLFSSLDYKPYEGRDNVCLIHCQSPRSSTHIHQVNEYAGLILWIVITEAAIT